LARIELLRELGGNDETARRIKHKVTRAMSEREKAGL
jgi:hypothetical protein